MRSGETYRLVGVRKVAVYPNIMLEGKVENMYTWLLI